MIDAFNYCEVSDNPQLKANLYYWYVYSKHTIGNNFFSYNGLNKQLSEWFDTVGHEDVIDYDADDEVGGPSDANATLSTNNSNNSSQTPNSTHQPPRKKHRIQTT